MASLRPPAIDLPRVLLVDDEARCRRSVAIGLRLEGFRVVEAPSGEDALLALEASPPDYVVVDLMMPGMNGIELLERVRVEMPNVGIVLTSAYHLTEEQLLRAGLSPSDFIAKPFAAEDLANLLREQISAAQDDGERLEALAVASAR